MGTVYRKSYTKPLPKGADLFTRKGERFARWKDRKSKARTARVTTGEDGSIRLIVESGTFIAKYRDGTGCVVEVTTGCRTRDGALSVLKTLTDRAERVRSGILSSAEDTIADHQGAPLSEHFDAYVEHLEAKRVSKTHQDDRERNLRRLAIDCRFARLRDLDRRALEHWLTVRADSGMSARSRNAYRAAAIAFCNWCVESRRLIGNPFVGTPKANERVDPRRKRRSLTEDELRRLVKVARLRPLAEVGRAIVRRPDADVRGDGRSRRTWTRALLTLENIDAAEHRARDLLADRPNRISELERVGRERSLTLKTLVLTGLRKSELDALAVKHLEFGGDVSHAVLDAADEKAGRGAEIPLRADLANDLRHWLADKLQAVRAQARAAGEAIPATLPPETPLFNVPTGLVRILDRDLAAAGIAKRDDRGRTVDVHALRTTFATHLGKGGVPLRTTQAAMRHSDPRLTANAYTDPRLLDIAGAMDVLPELPLDRVDEAGHHRATGTHSADSLAPVLAPDLHKRGPSESIIGKTSGGGAPCERDDEERASDATDNRNDPLSKPDGGSLRLGANGFEPSASCSQSRRSRPG